MSNATCPMKSHLGTLENIIKMLSIPSLTRVIKRYYKRNVLIHKALGNFTNISFRENDDNRKGDSCTPRLRNRRISLNVLRYAIHCDSAFLVELELQYRDPVPVCTETRGECRFIRSRLWTLGELERRAVRTNGDGRTAMACFASSTKGAFASARLSSRLIRLPRREFICSTPDSSSWSSASRGWWCVAFRRCGVRECTRTAAG